MTKRMVERREDRFHPQYVMLGLLLAGLSMLFLALSAAYLYARFEANLRPVRLPWLFFPNVLVLLTSSWTLLKAEMAFREDDAPAYRRQLSATFVLSVLFLFIQVVAWGQLYQMGLGLTSDLSTSYVYAMTILHFIHVSVGIPWLARFTWRAWRRLETPVNELVYFSDPVRYRHLRLLSRYWHFLDILWVYLVLFLGLNMLG